jgi:ribonuclease HII
MERRLKNRPVIGVDEVGRGCLAGDVFGAAVLEPTEHFDWWEEIRDSKKLSQKKREKLADLITENCVYAVHQLSVKRIDELNILNAALISMRNAAQEVYRLEARPDNTLILVDGNRPLPEIPSDVEQECIKGGDDMVKCIGAASILAKVARDHYMEAMHAAHPEYGWDRNKGYGTAEHREAIMVHGITPLHRRSFRGVAEYVV